MWTQQQCHDQVLIYSIEQCFNQYCKQTPHFSAPSWENVVQWRKIAPPNSWWRDQDAVWGSENLYFEPCMTPCPASWSFSAPTWEMGSSEATRTIAPRPVRAPGRSLCFWEPPWTLQQSAWPAIVEVSTATVEVSTALGTFHVKGKRQGRDIEPCCRGVPLSATWVLLLA